MTITINITDLHKAHQEMRTVRRGGKTFQRRTTISDEEKVQWNKKIDFIQGEMDEAAEKGHFSPMRAAGLKEMASNTGRLLQIKRFISKTKR